MLKKMLSAMVAALLMGSLSATALAAPGDPPASANIGALIGQVKAMCGEIAALRGQLAAEKLLDQQLRSDIAALKGFFHPDAAQIAAFAAQRDDLQEQASLLKQQLKDALSAKDKAKARQIRAQIKDLTSKIHELRKKIIPAGRSDLKEFRAQLKAEYAKLKPLLEEARALNAQLHALIGQLNGAVAAGDITAASGLLAQITAKVELLKGNINARIAIRNGIAQMVTAYKATLQQ
jgi:DNA repair exonuclease SbcCD ATPase subunit